MAFFDMFRPAPTNPAQSEQQSQQNNQQQSRQSRDMGNSSDDKSSMSDDQNKPEDPLAAYGKLFEESKEAPATPPSFVLDSELIGKTASGMNFMQGIPEEVVSAAQSGDAKALMQMMNAVGQKAYQAALSHTTQLTDRFVDARSKYDMDKTLAPRVKSELTAQALSSAPNYNNPVLREKLNEEARRIQQAYPDASPQEVAQMAQRYLTDLAAALNPNSQQQQKQQQDGEMDWAKYLEG